MSGGEQANVVAPGRCCLFATGRSGRTSRPGARLPVPHTGLPPDRATLCSRPMTLPIAERWFEQQRIDAAITRLWEPHVVPLMRCNIWHVRGRDRDLVIDTGMGIASLVAAMQQLLDKPVTAVATHGHGDHIGGHH